MIFPFRLRRLLTTLLYLIFFHASSQDSKQADSLKLVLKDKPLNDSTELFVLERVARLSSSPEDIIYYSEMLLSLAVLSQTRFYKSKAHQYLGGAYRLQGDLTKSLNHLFSGAEIAKDLDSSQILGEIYIEIASSYTQNKDSRNALTYNDKAVRIFRQTDDEQQLAITLLNTGFDHYTVNSLDTALNYYNEAAPIFQEIGLEIGKAYTIGNRALVYWKKGDYPTAKKDLLQAIEMLKPLGDQYGMADYYNQLGAIYLEQGQSKSAIYCTEKGLEMAIPEDLKEQVRDASLLLSKLYKEQGDFKRAYVYQEQHFAYKDSIQDRETTQRLADLRTDFEVGQKQAELDLMETEKQAERQQSLIVGGALSIVILLIAILAFVQYRNSKAKQGTNQILTAQKRELERVNSTKDKFFSIISHDLRGPVASFFGISRMIEVYVKSKNTDQLIELAGDIDESVERLSNLLDNLLNWATQQQGQVPFHPDKMSLAQVAENIKMSLQNMANGKKIELKTDVADEVFAFADQNTTETIVRNLTSNALKFTSENGCVTIKAENNGECVLVTVQDTGVGIPAEKMQSLFSLQENKSTYGTQGEKGLGLGLQLVDEFTKMNGGTLTVESVEGKGSAVSFPLPWV
jgi:two-component system NtrC family sensor kinase